MTIAYEKVKKWRIANPDKWRLACRESRKRNLGTVRARRKRYYAKHPDVVARQRDRRILGIRLLVDEIKASSGCVFCGENFPAALDFHHTGDKAGTVASCIPKSFTRAKEELDKCTLMCANCHRKLHAGVLSLDD
jgi:hypothetical protein